MHSLYHTELLEHYKSSPYRKKLAALTVSSKESNPSCGDNLEIMLYVVDRIIVDAGFQGTGCVISQAAMSMMCEEIIGKKIEAVLALSDEFIIELVGIPLGPVRKKCATLSLLVIKNGLSALE